jgi:cephalosporin hydroxylase
MIRIKYIPRILRIRSRFDFPRPSTVKSQELFGDKPVTVIEIGTDKGYNALNIMKSLNVKKIYLIDPYKPYSQYKRGEEYTGTSEYMLVAQKTAKKDLKRWDKKGKITWINKKSSEAFNEIKEKADFIYIDGNHDYMYVLDDLRNYWKLLKKGGIIAGHDINQEGVSKAVCQFIKDKDLHFTAYKQDWYILKQ